MTQKNKVVKYLMDNGCVTRNWALKNGITRLGAITNSLKKEGWKFRGYYFNNRADYKYKLTEKGVVPKKLRKIQSHLIASGRISL